MADFEPYDPVIPADLYPDGWSEIADFVYEDHLYLARAAEKITAGTREAQYLVAADYRVSFKVDGVARAITVPYGMLTDLTSVPWFARLFVGRVGAHLEAAIVHDFLFIAWQDIPGRGARREDFRFANRVMLQAMAKAGVPWWKRSLIYLLVSSFVGRWIYEAPNPDPRYVTVPWPPTASRMPGPTLVETTEPGATPAETTVSEAPPAPEIAAAPRS